MSQMDVSSAIAAAAAGGASGAKRGRKRARTSATLASRAVTLVRRGPGAGSSFLAPRARTVLNYSEDFVIAGAGTGQYIFNLNSLYDPNLTGGGHQPMGYDQLAALYGRYRVDRVRAKWSVINLWAGGTWAAMFADNDPGTGASYAAAEINGAQLKMLPVGGAGSEATVITSPWFKLNEICAASKKQYEDDDRYQAQVTASPSEGMYLHLQVYGLAAGVNLNTEHNLRLEFDCTFFDVKTQSVS